MTGSGWNERCTGLSSGSRARFVKIRLGLRVQDGACLAKTFYEGALLCIAHGHPTMQTSGGTAHPKRLDLAQSTLRVRLRCGGSVPCIPSIYDTPRDL